MTQQRQIRRGPPVGRHVGAVGLTIAVMLVFYWLDGNRDGQRLLPLKHSVLADASVVLLCLILMLGAGARLIPRLRPVLPWGRELGIAMFVTAGLHVAILVGPELDVIGFFGQNTIRGFKFDDGMWAAANWVGLFALGYALVLAATSNDWSQRTLGRGWKFTQRQVYTLFVLTWLHTAAFVVVGAGHGALLQLWVLVALTIATVGAQFAGFVHTVRSPRGPSTHRVPAKTTTTTDRAGLGAARWLAVVLLWGLFIVGSWTLAMGLIPSEEDRVKASPFCQRHLELESLDLSPQQRVEELSQFPLPTDDETGRPITLDEYRDRCR